MAKILLNVELNNNTAKEIEKIKSSLDKITVSKSSVANTAQLEKSYANLFNTIKNSKGSYPADLFNGVADKVQKAHKSIQQINKAFQTNHGLTDKEKASYSKLKQQLTQLSAEFATLRAEATKMEKANKIAIPNVDNLRKRYANLLNSIKSISQYYKKGTFDNITKQAQGYIEQLKSLDKTAPNYAEQVNNIDKALSGLGAEFEETKLNSQNFHGSLQEITAGFLKFQLAAKLVMIPLNLIRNAWTSLNETLVETENAVVALQRVLNDNSLSDSDISGKLYKLAQQYGQTFENANEIAQNFARTGMNWNETIKATEAALLALNVAELDTTEATDGMIAIMQQFGYEASDLEGIIDILNKTADNYAITTEKLLTALQRTGSSAVNANLSLKETVGIITSLSEATGRSGENLGTAVNSLIQFSTKTSALETFAKLSENMATIVENYKHGQGTVLDIWQGLSTEISNRQNNSENILSGLFGGDDWRSLNEELQDALGDSYAEITDIYDTASTFRKNYFIALLNNMDTVEEAIETANDAQGYSNEENEKYLDTYTAKVNTLKAKWEEICNDEQGLLGIKKTLVDLASGILNLIQWTGGFRTTLLALGTTLWALFGTKLIKQIKLIKTSILTMFAELKAGAITLNSALGIIGLIATAISMIVGIVESIKGEDTTSDDIQNAVDKLGELSDKLNGITKEAENTKKELLEVNNILTNENSTTEELSIAKNSLLEIQNKLIENNQDYANSIDLVNASYDEQLKIVDKYAENQMRKKVEDYLSSNKTDLQTAESYLSDKMAQVNFFGDSRNSWEGSFSKSEFAEWLENQGIATANYTKGDGFLDGGWNFVKGLFGSETSFTGISAGGKTREELITYLQNLYEQAKVYDNSNGTAFASIIATAMSSINNDTLQNAQKLIYGDKDAENWVEQLSYEQLQKFANGELSYDELLDILGIAKETTETTAHLTLTWEEQLGKVVSDYEDILDAINEARDTQQEIVDLEEKKLALQEAEQALEDAKNNKNVRVYNASTGQWELQADAKAIKDAEDAVKSAQESYEDAVWNNIENNIKKGTMTAGDIYEKVKEIATDFPSLAKTIRDVFVANGYKMPEYDSGGVLRGLGGIKATQSDEVVLPPELTKQILQPSSNAEFSQFAKSLGLLFGASKDLASLTSGMTVNNGNSSTADNRTYIANGIPFTRETAERHSLADLFEMAALYGNN